MKKYITLGLFLINSLSVFCNSDCDNINGFLKKNGINGVECCGKSHYILCKDDSDSIESIYLDDNVISNTMTSISFSDFPILEKLKHLTFTSRSDKFISIFNKSLPERFFELPNLEILEISKANITTIPNNLSSNNKIAKINLNNNELIAFPYQLKNLKKLVELDISRNNINCEITNEIKDFKSIETLIIGGNSINGNLVIPESLKNINLNNNLVSSISLSGSKNLKSFEGRNNNFNDNIIKTFIDAEVKLKSLTLGSNKNIKNIPENIYTLNTLENL
ncbi:L domain-like protein [Piromyces finnis]|uniref:L domain-like protein n=1 Tax=Piromyces finnis TaxID=1754191 RepID=A0A1Y1VBD1_9FUNG|nr:L domain-like protein [Piromyces finnis]|eukprot:ORX51023.1 L domain-like protein [Piromyces finnis]